MLDELTSLCRDLFALLAFIIAIQATGIYVSIDGRSVQTVASIATLFTLLVLSCVFYISFAVIGFKDANTEDYFSLLKISFNAILIVFMATVSYWLVLFNGVVNSPVSTVLCAYPVSLLFVAMGRKRSFDIFRSEGNSLKKRIIYIVDRILTVSNIAIYVFAVVLIELLLNGISVQGVPFVEKTSRLLRDISMDSDKISQIKGLEWYYEMSYISFYGSVIAAFVTYLSSSLE